jgi:hypothetical protein
VSTGQGESSSGSELIRLLIAVRGARSQAQAAHEAGMSQSKISRAERDRFPLTPDEARRYATRLGAPAEQVERLVDLTSARVAEQVTGRVALVRVAAALQERFRRLQDETTVKRSWVCETIPGDVQTNDYTATLLAGDGGGEVGPDWWAARRARVDAIHDPKLRSEILVSESACRWVIGSPALMAAQVRHLIELSRLPNIRLGVLDLATPKPFTAPRTFHLYDDTTVTVATDIGTSFVTDPADIAHYVALFERLDAAALHGDAARELLERIAVDHESR